MYISRVECYSRQKRVPPLLVCLRATFRGVPGVFDFALWMGTVVIENLICSCWILCEYKAIGIFRTQFEGCGLLFPALFALKYWTALGNYRTALGNRLQIRVVSVASLDVCISIQIRVVSVGPLVCVLLPRIFGPIPAVIALGFGLPIILSNALQLRSYKSTKSCRNCILRSFPSLLFTAPSLWASSQLYFYRNDLRVDPPTLLCVTAAKLCIFPAWEAISLEFPIGLFQLEGIQATALGPFHRSCARNTCSAYLCIVPYPFPTTFPRPCTRDLHSS